MKTRAVTAALLNVAAGLLACELASANESLRLELQSSPHKILFESYIGDNWEICVMNADGTGRRNLTNTPDLHELYPQASPDGKRICFLADTQQGRNTLRSVYYMNADGTDRHLVAERSRQPCWSPDGTKIAFLPQEFQRFAVADFVSKGLEVYDIRSGATEPHPNKAIHHLYTLNWSSNGNWFVATVHGGMGFGHGILALAADGDAVVDLKIAGCRPGLSADGTRVTWSEDDHTILAADIDLVSGEPRVTNPIVIDKRDELHLYHPDFSPDGKYITYSIGPGGRVASDGPGTHTQVAEMVGVRGRWNIFAMRANGEGQPLQLTKDENLSNKESEWIVAGERGSE